MSEGDAFAQFHTAIQDLGRAYLRAVLAVPVPEEVEGREMYALLAMTVGACKQVGMEEVHIIDTVVKFVHGGVRLTERPDDR